jgi:hypothetical protein
VQDVRKMEATAIEASEAKNLIGALFQFGQNNTMLACSR